jgi:hypothetical protein
MATETSEPGPMDEEEGYANMANAEVHPLRARDMDPISELGTWTRLMKTLKRNLVS